MGPNYVYESKPDGLTAFVSSGTTTINQLLGASEVHYDLTKMPVSIAIATSALFYMKPGIISRPEDILKAKGLVFGHTQGTGIVYAVTVEFLGIPMDKVIMAYGGGAEANRALLSGEINITGESPQGYAGNVAPYVAKGEIMTLFQTGIFNEKGNAVRDMAFPPDIMTAVELYEKLNGKAPSGMLFEAYRAIVAASFGYSRILALPPRTPDNVVKAYWSAAEAMLKDSEFRKIVDPLVGKDARWMVGEAFDNELKLNYGAKPEVVNWIRKTMMEKYKVVL